MVSLVALVLPGAFAAEPSADEQAFVWALNRARRDPAEWAAERGIDRQIGGEGQPTTLDDVPARPPLALQTLLVGSARGHSEEMAENDYFDHESPVDGRWPNDVVRDAGYPLPDAIPTADGLVWPLSPGANNVESIAAGWPDSLAAFDALLVDAGADPPTHRDHLLGADEFFATHREIGVGREYDEASTWKDYWTIHTGVADVADAFLTGVVYDDVDGDGAFDPGEGLGGVEVTVGATAVTTLSEGGWSLRVDDGDYAVSCAGPGFSGTATGTVAVRGASREVDFASGFGGAIVDFERVEPAPDEQSASCATSAAPTWLFAPVLWLTARGARRGRTRSRGSAPPPSARRAPRAT